MQDELRGTGAWRVRILNRSADRVVGAGVLVAGSRILSCAHVVTSALDRDDSAHPEAPVSVNFAASKEKHDWTATVRADGWFPAGTDHGDLAVLDLNATPPPEAKAASLHSSREFHGQRLAVFGHPGSAQAGVWIETRMIGPGGDDPDWIQLTAPASVGGIERGYSGAGVHYPPIDAVVGMIVATYRRTEISWMLPMEVAATYWKPLRTLLTESSGPRVPLGLDVTSELVNALLAVPVMRGQQGHQAVLDLLGPTISVAVPYSPQPRLNALNLIQTCQHYPGGLKRLVDAVLLLDSDSMPARELWDVATRLLEDDAGGAQAGGRGR